MGHLQGREITIIGAGVAGLTAALALRARGAEVTVHEQAPAIEEVGAGIQLAANAMRVMAALGLADALDKVSLRNHAVILRDHKGNEVVRLDMLAHRPANQFRLIHRARLIDTLAEGARQAGIPLLLNSPVAEPAASGLTIGADGLRSRMRQVLNGREVAFFTRQTAWRAVIADRDETPCAQVFMGPGQHLVSYPLGQGLRNLVAVQERHDWSDEGWSRRDDPANLRRAFDHFGGPVPAWLSAVDEVYIWGLFRHEIARKWHDDSIVLIGDALHPTLPFMAQGAALAIEDAWLLAACLDAIPHQPAALARFEAIRRARVSAIVQAANANARNYHLGGIQKQIAHAGLRLIGRVAPQRLVARFDWIYDYDPLAEAQAL